MKRRNNPFPGKKTAPPTEAGEQHTKVDLGSVPSLSIRKDPFDYVLIGATAILVILAAIQLCFLRATIAVAKESAEAAKFSADALIASERAWVVVSGTAPLQPHPYTTRPIEFLFDLTNKGRTTARVMGLRIGRRPAWNVAKGNQFILVTHPAPDARARQDIAAQ